MFSLPFSNRRQSTQEARALFEAGAPLLDVRTREEFGAGHVDGALNIPVGELANRLGELGDRERPILVHCARGGRSASACKMLRSAGFTNVIDVGALPNW